MVASGKVFTSPDLLRFRDPSSFVPGSIHLSLPLWSERSFKIHPTVHHSFASWSSESMSKSFSLSLRVLFKVKFITVATFPNGRSSQAFSEFITETILERVANGSLSVWGRVGEVPPPHLVMSITVEPSKPRMCHDERFLILWIKDPPFSLDLITDLPRYVYKGSFQTTCGDKSGYDIIRLSPDSRTYLGLQWNDWYFVLNTLPFGWKASVCLCHSSV